MTNPDMHKLLQLSTFLMLVLGSVLLAVGIILLIYIAYIVLTIASDPHSVAIVNYFASDANSESGFISARIDGRDFELQLSPALLNGLYLLIGVLILSVLATIVRTLVSSGMEILNQGLRKFQLVEKKRGKTDPWEDTDSK